MFSIRSKRRHLHSPSEVENHYAASDRARDSMDQISLASEDIKEAEKLTKTGIWDFLRGKRRKKRDDKHGEAGVKVEAKGKVATSPGGSAQSGVSYPTGTCFAPNYRQEPLPQPRQPPSAHRPAPRAPLQHTTAAQLPHDTRQTHESHGSGGAIAGTAPETSRAPQDKRR